MIIPLPGGAQIDTGNDPSITYADDGKITLHTPLALSRLIERWKNQPVFAALLASYTDQVQLLENALLDIITQRLPDYADTAQLDAIGRIVGEPRRGQSNAQYRARIKVRIRINQSFGTAEDVIEVLQLLDPALFTYVEFASYFEIRYSQRPVSAAVASQIPEIISQTRAAGVGAVVIIPGDALRGARYGTAYNAAINQHLGNGHAGNDLTGGLYAHAAKA